MIVPNQGTLTLPGGGLLSSVSVVSPSSSDQPLATPIDPGGIVTSATYVNGVWTIGMTGDGLVRAGLNDAARWMFDPAALGYQDALASNQELALVWEWLTGPATAERQFVGLAWCDGAGNPATVANGTAIWDQAGLTTIRAFSEAATVTPSIITAGVPATLVGLQTWNLDGSTTMGQIAGTGKGVSGALTTSNSIKATAASAPVGAERWALCIGNQLASTTPGVFTGRLLAGIRDRWAGF